jgi:hypothetical protein
LLPGGCYYPPGTRLDAGDNACFWVGPNTGSPFPITILIPNGGARAFGGYSDAWASVRCIKD